MNRMRAALLTRVSTAEQAVADRHSLPVQRQMLTDYANREGYEVVATFEIPGESAFTDDIARRPQFNAAITAAEQGVFDILLIYDLSRFARDQYLLQDSLRRLRKANVRLIGVAMGVDYTDNPMLAGMEGVFVEASSREHSRRVRHAYARRHELGLPTGELPFGYQPGPTPLSPAQLVPVEAEAIAELFRDYVAGMGYSTLSARLNARGLSPRSRRGKTAFTPSSIQSLIENDFYCGYVRHYESRRKGIHQPIITEELWLAAQARPCRTGRPAVRNPRFLSGVAICDHCEGPVWITKSGRNGKMPYYKEAARIRQRPCEQAGRLWSALDVEGQVTTALESMGSDREWLALIENIARRPEADIHSERRSRLVEEKRRLFEGYRAAVIDEAEWRRETRLIDLQIAELPQPQNLFLGFGPKLESIAQAWRGLEVRERKELCQQLFEQVRLDFATRNVYVQPWPDFQPYFQHRREYCAVLGTPERTRRYRDQRTIELRELAA